MVVEELEPGVQPGPGAQKQNLLSSKQKTGVAEKHQLRTGLRTKT